MRKFLYVLAMASTLGVFVADTLLLGERAIREGWWSIAFFVFPASCLVLAMGGKEPTKLRGAAIAVLVLGIAGYVTMRLAFGNVAGEPSVRVGEKAPAFSLQDQDGKDVSLADLVARGRAVLVFFRGPL